MHIHMNELQGVGIYDTYVKPIQTCLFVVAFWQALENVCQLICWHFTFEIEITLDLII
jgi:hypothetical protein